MQTYVRWQKGQPRRMRVFPGMTEEDRAGYGFDSADEELCDWCRKTLFDQTPIQLIAMGPVDVESAIRMDRGGWITALCVAVHEVCADDAKIDQ